MRRARGVGVHLSRTDFPCTDFQALHTNFNLPAAFQVHRAHRELEEEVKLLANEHLELVCQGRPLLVSRVSWWVSQVSGLLSQVSGLVGQVS